MNTSFIRRPHSDLPDLRFISWLEMAHAGLSLSWKELSARVVVRLMDLQGSRAWWGVTLDDRWLRGSGGAVTIFDSLPAAGRFLRLLKVNRFNISEHVEHGPLVAGEAQEVFTLGDRCKRCQRSACDAAPEQDIFRCPEISQRRPSMKGNFTACQPQRHASPVPGAA